MPLNRRRHWRASADLVRRRKDENSRWTVQNVREDSAVLRLGEEPHRFLIHDHDSIYSDRAILGGLHHGYRLESRAA
jgi:hypothetical protein